MGFLDFLKPKPPPGTSARGPDFVGGSTEPDPMREPWLLTLLKRQGSTRLALVAPHGTQEICAIHERLRPLLERLPDGTDLYYLCRVAEGKHYNVLNLIAVEVSEQSNFARVVRWLDDDFVRARPAVLVARLNDRIAQGDEDGALEDLARVVDANADGVDVAWRRLSPAARQRAMPLYASWLGRRELSTRLAELPLERWTDEHLVAAANAVDVTGRWNATFSMQQLVDELDRRGSGEADALRKRAERSAWLDAMSQPERLLPERLAQVLATRSRDAIAIYGDALTEQGHPYGEFISLHLKGSTSAARQAKRLADEASRSWLGPIADVAGSVVYDLGLPVALEVAWDASGTELAAIVAHPLLAAFRRIVRRKTKKARRTDVARETMTPLSRAALAHSLVELDCFDGGLTSVADLDLSRVTHLHDLDLLEAEGEAAVDPRDVLVPSKLRSVEWVEVRVNPGQSAVVLDVLQRDTSGFFAARRPHLDFFFVNGASAAERSRVKAAVAKLAARAVTIGGQPVPLG